MKTILNILTLFLLLTNNKASSQCGLVLNYNYLAGPCDTLLLNVSVNISGSTCTSFSILWEDMTTATGTQLDTGYHYVYIYDCFGCETIDTFYIGCTDWTGTTSSENIENKTEFKIQPNLGAELINVTNNRPIEKIFIYNTSGLLLKELENVNAESFLINITDFKNGLYFLKIESGNDCSVKKFIKI